MKKYRPAFVASLCNGGGAWNQKAISAGLYCEAAAEGIGLVLERVGVAVHWYEEHVQNVNANEVAVAYLCVGHSDCVLRP